MDAGPCGPGRALLAVRGAVGEPRLFQRDVDVQGDGADAVIRLASAGLWLGVGLAKMAALVWLIDEKWQQALLALVLAWSLAGLALWLRGLRRA